MGERGIYLTSFFSGLFDVDAIVVSMSNLAKNGLDKPTAALAIIIATVTNTFSKCLIFLFLGNLRVALKILAIFSLAIVAGVLVTLFAGSVI